LVWGGVADLQEAVLRTGGWGRLPCWFANMPCTYFCGCLDGARLCSALSACFALKCAFLSPS